MAGRRLFARIVSKVVFPAVKMKCKSMTSGNGAILSVALISEV